ncbi:hypothetical protein HanXRQr2_Chr01g0021891 [Helianthus annuus]|uniref:Uncharacterized protein n=1 Tax=Helianthus annuus TaxID=4232 RepID=A0A9K3JWM6_HELAN|nr:hypothetical protein HanXRQr2_Chr01g0021891 [Helianthus annuus]
MSVVLGVPNLVFFKGLGFTNCLQSKRFVMGKIHGSLASCWLGEKSNTEGLVIVCCLLRGVNFEDTEDIAVSCYTKTYRVFQMFVRDSLEWMYLVRRGVINFFVGLLFLRMLILYTVLASD